MTAKLSGERLTLIRGERCLFKNLSFALQAGEALLLEGDNGSGKTSLMRIIAGLLSPESGTVLWNGEPIDGQAQDYRASLVWLGHKTGLKGDLTMIENLRFERELRRRADVDAEEVYKRLRIERLKKLPVRSLSAGQQRRVALARLLLADTPLWLLDEPFTNLDRDGRSLLQALASEHLARGGMCVLAAHQDVVIDADVHRVSL